MVDVLETYLISELEPRPLPLPLLSLSPPVPLPVLDAEQTFPIFLFDLLSIVAIALRYATVSLAVWCY